MPLVGVRQGFVRDGHLRGSEAVAVDTLTLVPVSGFGHLNSPYSLIATLKDSDGNPREGVSLFFTVTGANTETFDDVTDALGQVTFTYAGTNIGTDTVTVTLSPGGDYETIVVADGPEVYYRFEGTTTPIPDFSGNANVGNPLNVYTQDVVGAVDDGIHLGSGAGWGRVEVDTPIPGDDISNKESWEFWLYRTADPTNVGPVIVEGQNGFQPTIIWNHDEGEGIGIRNTDNNIRICAPNPPAVDTWEHYVIIHDRADSFAYVYQNGELVNSGTFEAFPGSPDGIKGVSGIGVDADTPATNYWIGRVDEFAYYHRALTEAEVVEHYQTVAGESEQATVEWAVRGSGGPGRRTARLVP